MAKLRWRLRELMGKMETETGQRITYQMITKATNISPNTLSLLVTGKAKQVGISTIIGLLEFFDCEPNDLIVRVRGEGE
jgi:DNA-binding Xre family transcriptional regulator